VDDGRYGPLWQAADIAGENDQIARAVCDVLIKIYRNA